MAAAIFDHRPGDRDLTKIFRHILLEDDNGAIIGIVSHTDMVLKGLMRLY